MNWRHAMIRATWEEMEDQASIYQDANVYLRGQLIGTVSFGVFSAILV